MKKSWTILLTLFYSLSVFGIGLKEIYCCGKLKTVTVSITVNEKHNCNKQHEPNGCCTTKYHYLKVQDSHLASTANSIANKSLIEIHAFTTWYQPSFHNIKYKAVIHSFHEPPLHYGVPIHIYNCVYRI
ncbi:MAG: HYC_CC_PP family protein [Flavisolibacter sp.]|jgi:hypothetical protein